MFYAVVYVYIYIQFIYDLFGNEIRAIGINNKIGRKSTERRKKRKVLLFIVVVKIYAKEDCATC